MRFLKAIFRRYCVKKPRNASALLSFSPCLDKNLLFKNCFAPEGLVFLCSVVLLCRNHTDVSVPKSTAMCGKTSPSGILRRTFFSLPRSCIWIPRVGEKTLKRAKLFSISSINKDYISYETLILIGFVKYSLFLFVLLFGLR